MLILLLVLCGAAQGADMKIAILRDSFPAACSHADPEKLARILRQAHDVSQSYDVDFISADQLADPASFNAERYWLVILPYGSYFPAAARDNFLAYLRAGGDFLSTGGYAFDSPVIRWKDHWLTAEDALRTIPTHEVNVGSDGDRIYLTGKWNAPEPWGDGNGTKRWSGKSAGLRLTVDPAKRYTLSIQLATNPAAAAFKRRILINGKPVLDIPATVSDDLKLHLGPDQFAGRRELDLTFDCDLWKPKDITNSSDTRLLGVAVGQVRLIPDGPAEPQPDLSPLSKPINMRHGKGGDFLEWKEEQLGVFDAGYPLTDGKSISPASDQHIVPLSYSLKGSFEGMAAAGTTGSAWYWNSPADRSRLIPLLETRDEFGRFRGNAGSLMINTLPPYRGSIWAYFGIDNRDIFSAPDGVKLFLSVVNGMKRGQFLHDLHTSYACYRQGEEVSLQVNASDLGKASASDKILITISDESGRIVFTSDTDVVLGAGETKEVTMSWRPTHFDDDFYTIKADLIRGDEVTDTLRAGFYVWNEDTLHRGMDLTYSGNYLRDSGKPRFMLGSEPFYSLNTTAGVTALDIERDFTQLADLGLHVARVFTYSDSEVKRRFADALVMAAQRHRVNFFLTGVAPIRGYLEHPDEVRPLATANGQRYRGVLGMMLDFENEPNSGAEYQPMRDARFNDYLKKVYGTTDALRAAWGDELGSDEEIGRIKMGWMTADWTSIRSRDIYRFIISEGSRWTSEIAGAVKAEDPSRLCSVGYLQGGGNWMTMDPAATSDGLDFINRHWYGNISDLSEYDAEFAMSDRRYCGKSPSTGEFGSKTFPTFAETGHNYDTVEQQEERFLHIGHYCLALGGIFESNWHFRDPGSYIFPYGIVYSDWTLKPVAKVCRAMSMLFSDLRPRYVEPDVYLVLPDESRFGGGCDTIRDAIKRAANALIASRIRFGSIGEWKLGQLPKSARLLILPSPFALSDTGYNHLREFVKGGGVLYISGDFSYDENRCRTKTSRLEELAGIRFIRERYPNICPSYATREAISYEGGPSYIGNPSIEFEPTSDACVVAQSGEKPVAVLREFGSGAVIFSADPAEFGSDAPLSTIYTLAADIINIKPEQASPVSAEINIFRIPLEGGEAVMVGNLSGKSVRVKVDLGGHTYSAAVASNRQAMLVSRADRLIGLEAQGDVYRDGKLLASAQHHFFAVSLDGKDLGVSRQIAFTGLSAGRYSLNCKGLVAEAGEVRNGKWQPLKYLGSDLKAPDSLAGDVILLASHGSVIQARQKITSLLTQ